MTNIQHIYFCTDKKYLPHAAVTMASVLRNAHKRTRISFHILGSDLDDEARQKLRQLNQIAPCEIECINVNPHKFDTFFMNMGYLSMATYYRFLIPQIAPKEAEKVLYLDGDMIVTAPLDNLFKTNMQNYKIAAVEEKDAFQTAKLGLKSKRYFNAGMILFNLKNINKKTFFAEAEKYFIMNKQNITSHDQDVLNGIFDGQVKFVDVRYNVESFVKNIKDPLIIHYTGFMKKPWLYFSRHPQKYLWRKYEQMTPWRKNFWQLRWFDIKEFASKIFFIKKDPTHTKHYIVHFMGARFGIGKKDDKQMKG